MCKFGERCDKILQLDNGGGEYDSQKFIVLCSIPRTPEQNSVVPKA